MKCSVRGLSLAQTRSDLLEQRGNGVHPLRYDDLLGLGEVLQYVLLGGEENVLLDNLLHVPLEAVRLVGVVQGLVGVFIPQIREVLPSERSIKKME